MTDDETLRKKQVGRILSANREKIGLTQYDLATKLGVTQAAISAWERGVRIPRWTDLRALAVALDIPADAIIYPMIQDLTDFREHPQH